MYQGMPLLVAYCPMLRKHCAPSLYATHRSCRCDVLPNDIQLNCPCPDPRVICVAELGPRGFSPITFLTSDCELCVEL
jgi:hypothetical protein